MTRRLRRFIILLLIILTGVFATFYGGTVTHALFYGALLLPFWSYLYLLLTRLRFRLYQSVEVRTCTKLTPLSYLFTLGNESFFTFCHVSVTFHHGNSHVEGLVTQQDTCQHYSLLPGESIDVPATLLCHYRGEYPIGVDCIQLEDYFHLFQYTFHCANPIVMQVFPRIIELHSLCCIPDQEDEKRSSYLNSPSDGIPDSIAREYAPGDSQRRIHWKATARTQKLMTRSMVNPSKTNMAVLFDWQPALTGKSLAIEDTLLEAGLSILHYLTLHQIDAKIYGNNKEVSVRQLRTMAHFDDFYQYCQKASFQSETSIKDLFAYYPELNNSQTHLLILTCHLSDSLYLSCAQAVEYGTTVHVVTVHPDGANLSYCKKSMDPRVHLYPLIAGRDIRTVLEGRDS